MRCSTFIAVVLVALSAVAQQPPTSPSIPALPVQKTPYHVEAGAWYSALSRDYSDWRGVDVRLQYTSPRATPFLIVSSQTRREGTQQNIALGSYLIWSDRYYSIVGISHAPSGSAELYPKTRIDASLLGNVRSVPGLVWSGGVTSFFGSNNTGGQIFSAGGLYYRGPTVSNGVVRFNRDRRSGAFSHSFQIGTQYGAQGRSWIGGSVSRGTEAYEVVAAVPFDARFRGVGASLFWQKWLATNRGFFARYDFEHKYTAYVRNGLALTYFVDF